MLSPNTRGLYTTALTPPPGYRFDEGIGTTFSLDPGTLLGIPIHLALSRQVGASPVRDGIAAYEALRRVADRLTIYAQRGRLQAPGQHHLLYSLLEPMVVEVKAPRGGVFHPKLWVLRFEDALGIEPPLIRLLVLSRNLTMDRSWDLALQLEGHPGRRRMGVNRELGELVTALPGLAFGAPTDAARQAQADRLAEELRRVAWDLPSGFDSVTFYALGLGRRTWRPEPAHEMAVIAPFCKDDALLELSALAKRPQALIARPETLAALAPETLARFEGCYVLDEAAEVGDGDDPDPGSGDLSARRDTFGLHAKAYLFRRGWHTHVVVGSANATDAALLAGRNVEIMAELVGKRSAVGDIDALLGPDGLGEVLTPFDPPAPPDQAELERQAAERALEQVREAIANATLTLRCEPSADDGWLMILSGPTLPSLPGVALVRVWPLSMLATDARDAAPLWRGEPVTLGPYTAVGLTGLMGFELISDHTDVRLRFALNLPVDNMPGRRDAELLRLVIENADGFLRYLWLLLGDDDPEGHGIAQAAAGASATWGAGLVGDSVSLLEPMTRAFARDPARLEEISALVRRLRQEPDWVEAIVPPDFDELWCVFETALEARRGT